MKLWRLTAANEQEIDAAFARFVQHRRGALLVESDVFFNARRDQFVALAARHAVPAIYDRREFVTLEKSQRLLWGYDLATWSPRSATWIRMRGISHRTPTR